MNPHEKLNTLFEQARQSIQLLDKDEIQNLISSPEPAVKPKSATKTFIIGTAATIVICGAIYFIYPKDETPKKVAEQKTILFDSSNKNTNQQPQIINETPLIISSEKKVETKIIDNPPSKKSEDLKFENKNSVQTKTEDIPIFPNTSISNYPKRVDEEKQNNDGYLHLTNEELANLGIITDGNVLRYLNRTDTSKIINDYYGKSILSFAYDIDVEKHGSMRTNNTHKADSILESSSNPNIPLLISITEVKSKKENWMIGNGKLPHDLKDKYIEEIKPKLIPIVVNLKGKTSLYSYDNDVAFWYRNNEMLRNSLPHEIALELKKHYPDFDENAYQSYLKHISNTSKEAAKKYSVSKEEIENIKSKMLFLSNKDLKKLGIKFNGKKLVCKQSTLSSNGKYFGLELVLTPELFLINISDNLWHPSTDSQKNLWYCSDSSFQIIHDFTDNLSEQDEKKYYDFLREKNTRFKSRIDSMIPVFVSFDEKAIRKSKEKDPLKSQILWFPKNEAFLKKLSKENQEKILNTKKVDKTIDISKIHLLELNKTELNKFGVVSKTSSIKFPISWKNGQDFIEYTDKGSSATFNTLSQKEYYDLPLEERGDSAQIYFNDKNEYQYVYFKKSSVYFILPIIVTDIKGKHAYLLNDNQRYELHDTDFEYMRKYEIDTATYYFTNQYREYAKKCLRSRMQTFVPILVKSSDQQLQMILWYEPTDSFFASLPKPIADEIKLEYTAILANQPTPSCKYFEVCQSVKGMINEYSVFPNPTNNELNVLIDLAEERKLTISLTDISGKIVKNFSKDLVQSKGKKEYPFQIGDVSEGMYLLLIETDKGERVTQRIIKK